MKLLLATRNRDKIAELGEILSDLPVELVSLSDVGDVPEVEEDADSFEERSARVDGKPFDYRVAMKGGEAIGFVAVGSAAGYSSVLRVMVGVDRSLTIQGIKVLYQNETPGLGTKVDEIKSKKTWWTVLSGTSPDESTLRPWFQVQFDGKPAPVKVEKDGGTIESITGATISSRAVCTAVDQAVEDLKKAVGS